MVAQLAVAFEVEVRDHVCKICWLHLSETIFPLELSELLRIDGAAVGSVDALERCVWFKVSHCRQYLPQFLDGYLLLGMVNEDLLNFEF